MEEGVYKTFISYTTKETSKIWEVVCQVERWLSLFPQMLWYTNHSSTGSFTGGRGARRQRGARVLDTLARQLIHAQRIVYVVGVRPNGVPMRRIVVVVVVVYGRERGFRLVVESVRRERALEAHTGRCEAHRGGRHAG